MSKCKHGVMQDGILCEECIAERQYELYKLPATQLDIAISALVEYITVKGYYATQEASDKWKAVCEKADEARESYQESE